jgi:hypothetical protein
MRVVAKGRKLYIDSLYGPSPSDPNKMFARELAFNGSRTTDFMKHLGSASVSVTRNDQAETRGLGFFDVNFLNLSEKYIGDDMSLHAFLRRPVCRVRKDPETIDGHQCVVVDCYEPGTEKVMESVSIDTKRGFVPLRHVYNKSPEYDKPQMEFVAKEVNQVDGIWLITAGSKKLFPGALPQFPRLNQGGEWLMKVDRRPDGSPEIAVNRGVKDEFFDLWKRLPAGTMLVDAQTGVAKRVVEH